MSDGCFLFAFVARGISYMAFIPVFLLYWNVCSTVRRRGLNQKDLVMV